MDNSCIKQTVCKVLNIFQHGNYLVAYVLKFGYFSETGMSHVRWAPEAGVHNNILKYSIFSVSMKYNYSYK